MFTGRSSEVVLSGEEVVNWLYYIADLCIMIGDIFEFNFLFLVRKL